jgi:hypothetical protein
MVSLHQLIRDCRAADGRAETLADYCIQYSVPALVAPGSANDVIGHWWPLRLSEDPRVSWPSSARDWRGGGETPVEKDEAGETGEKGRRWWKAGRAEDRPRRSQPGN